MRVDFQPSLAHSNDIWRGYSFIVTSNSSNEDTMLCVFICSNLSWYDLSCKALWCSSIVSKSKSSLSDWLFMLVPRNEKLCLWKGKTLIVQLHVTDPFFRYWRRHEFRIKHSEPTCSNALTLPLLHIQTLQSSFLSILTALPRGKLSSSQF